MKETGNKGWKMPTWGWVGLTAGTIVIITCVIGWYHRTEANEGAFAIINSIFSGLAFVGLTIAIFMQREELELQRTELADTRAEFKQQNDTLKHQRFETTFFNLLEVFHGCQDEHTYKDYMEMWSDLSNRLQDPHNEVRTLKGGTESELNIVLEHAKGVYVGSFFVGFNKSYITTYVLNLFNALKYVDSSDLIAHEEKGFYANILISQIADIELVLLGYYLLLIKGDDKTIELSKKYKVLTRFDTKCFLYDYFRMLFYREQLM